jgi:hypothetical protein
MTVIVQASPTKCGRSIVVACWADDRTDHGGGKRRVIRNEPVLAGCTPGAAFLFAMIGSRRVHLPVAIVSIGREGTISKEDRHEKEGQEEIEAHVKKCNAARFGSVRPAARRA